MIKEMEEHLKDGHDVAGDNFGAETPKRVIVGEEVVAPVTPEDGLGAVTRERESREEAPERIFFTNARKAWEDLSRFAREPGREEDRDRAGQEWERSLKALVGTSRDFSTVDLSPEQRADLGAVVDQLAKMLETDEKPADARTPEDDALRDSAATRAVDFFKGLEIHGEPKEPEFIQDVPVQDGRTLLELVEEEERGRREVHVEEVPHETTSEHVLTLDELLQEGSLRDELVRKIASGEISDANFDDGMRAIEAPFATDIGRRELGERIVGDETLRTAAKSVMVPDGGGELGLGQLEYFLSEVARTPRDFEAVCRERRLRLAREIAQREQEHESGTEGRLGVLRERLAALDASAGAYEALEGLLYGRQHDYWKKARELQEEARKIREQAVVVRRETLPAGLAMEETPEVVHGSVVDEDDSRQTDIDTEAIEVEGTVVDSPDVEHDEAVVSDPAHPEQDEVRNDGIEKPKHAPAEHAPDQPEKSSKVVENSFTLETAEIKKINELRDIEHEIAAAVLRKDEKAEKDLRETKKKHIKFIFEKLEGSSAVRELLDTIRVDDLAAIPLLEAKKKRGETLTPEEAERLESMVGRRDRLTHYLQHRLGLHPETARMMYVETAFRGSVTEKPKDATPEVAVSSAPAPKKDIPVVIDLSDMEDGGEVGEPPKKWERVTDFIKFLRAEGAHAGLERADAKAQRARAEIVATDREMEQVRKKIADIDGTIERLEKEHGAISPKTRLEALRDRAKLEKELERLEKARGHHMLVLEKENTRKDELRSECMDITDEVLARLNERLSPDEQRLRQARERRDQLEAEQRAFEARRAAWQQEIQEHERFAHQKEYPGKRIEAREKILQLKEKMKTAKHQVESRRDERKKWERAIEKLEKKVLPIRQRRDQFAVLAKREVADTKSIPGVTKATDGGGITSADTIDSVSSSEKKTEKKISTAAYISAWNTYFGSEAPIRETRFQEMLKLTGNEEYSVGEFEKMARGYFDAEMRSGTEYAPRFLATLDDKLKDMREYIT